MHKLITLAYKIKIYTIHRWYDLWRDPWHTQFKRDRLPDGAASLKCINRAVNGCTRGWESPEGKKSKNLKLFQLGQKHLVLFWTASCSDWLNHITWQASEVQTQASDHSVKGTNKSSVKTLIIWCALQLAWVHVHMRVCWQQTLPSVQSQLKMWSSLAEQRQTIPVMFSQHHG